MCFGPQCNYAFRHGFLYLESKAHNCVASTVVAQRLCMEMLLQITVLCCSCGSALLQVLTGSEMYLALLLLHKLTLIRYDVDCTEGILSLQVPCTFFVIL